MPRIPTALLLSRQAGPSNSRGASHCPGPSDQVRSALVRLGRVSLPIEPQFLVGSDSKSIALDDASMDVILCFDVLEHILDYRAIIPEWYRVLHRRVRSSSGGCHGSILTAIPSILWYHFRGFRPF